MLYIALILSLATATGFALLAAKRGKDYNRLLERYKNSLDICTMWRRAALKSARDVVEREKCITELTNQVNHLKPNNCKLISSLFGDIDDKIDKRCVHYEERSVENEND